LAGECPEGFRQPPVRAWIDSPEIREKIKNITRRLLNGEDIDHLKIEIVRSCAKINVESAEELVRALIQFVGKSIEASLSAGDRILLAAIGSTHEAVLSTHDLIQQEGERTREHLVEFARVIFEARPREHTSPVAPASKPDPLLAELDNSIALKKRLVEEGILDQKELDDEIALKEELETDEAEDAINRLFRAGKTEEAEEALRDFIKKHPDEYNGWLLLGDNYLAKGAKLQAAASYQKILEIRLSHPKNCSRKMETLVRKRLESLGPLPDRDIEKMSEEELEVEWDWLAILQSSRYPDDEYFRLGEQLLRVTRLGHKFLYERLGITPDDDEDT
jgi:tetratricopeptide (TPR) repeat protein